MGTFGFSYIGLLYVLMLTIPNLIWTRYLPKQYDPSNESKVLLWFERIGQVLCTCCVLVFSDFNLKPFTTWSLWLIASFGTMLLYEVCWVRYFKSKRTLKDFYGSIMGIPVPLATLPVVGFFLLGIYGKVIWLIISAIIIGIGHIGIHLQHAKEIK